MTAVQRFPAVLMLVLAAAGAAPLGAQPAAAPEHRFFTTPAERQRLDALRDGEQRTPPVNRVAAKKAPPPLPEVEVRGIVVRSSGPGAVWVNDGNTLRGEHIGAGVRVRPGPGGRALVLLPERGPVSLRPGQTYDPASGAAAGIEVRGRP